MALNPLFSSVDELTEVGRFFVAITRRLEDCRLTPGDDVHRLARALGIPVPCGLANTTIEVLRDTEIGEDRDLTVITVKYPVEPGGDSPGPVIEKKFQKCFKSCQKIAGATVCAKVCISIDIGLGGISGDLSATVTVKF